MRLSLTSIIIVLLVVLSNKSSGFPIGETGFLVEKSIKPISAFIEREGPVIIKSIDEILASEGPESINSMSKIIGKSLRPIDIPMSSPPTSPTGSTIGDPISQFISNTEKRLYSIYNRIDKFIQEIEEYFIILIHLPFRLLSG